MSVKFLEKRVIPALAILIIIALYVLAFVMMSNPKTVVLPEDEFEVIEYVFSSGETLWDFWSENIGSDNCSWQKYNKAVRDLNEKSAGDIKAGESLKVYYMIGEN